MMKQMINNSINFRMNALQKLNNHSNINVVSYTTNNIKYPGKHTSSYSNVLQRHTSKCNISVDSDSTYHLQCFPLIVCPLYAIVITWVCLVSIINSILQITVNLS